jgi:hypothetical protein
MIDYILEKFTEIASKCLERNAKENATIKKNMQLVFKLNGEEVEYLIYKEYKPLKAISFLQVLGVKLDFKGYSLFVPKFIHGALNRYSTEMDIQKSNVRVVLNFNNSDELLIFVYDNNEFKKQVQLEDLFDSQDMMSV